MDLNSLYQTVEFYCSHAGQGILTGAAVGSATAAIQSRINGTTFMEECGSRITQGVAAATGALAAIPNISPDSVDGVVGAVGASGVGAVVGGALRALRQTAEPIGERMRTGAVRGAIGFPVLYGVLYATSQLFK